MVCRRDRQPLDINFDSVKVDKEFCNSSKIKGGRRSKNGINRAQAKKTFFKKSNLLTSRKIV